MIALARSLDDLREAFVQHGPAWEQSLVDDRDQLRGAMASALSAWEGLWARLQVNTANRSLARSGQAQAPELFSNSFRAPTVRDGNVVLVGEVLAGLRAFAQPEQPNENAVENAEIGAEPTRHRPPSQQGFASAGASSVAFGPTRPPEAVQAWVEQDEAEARSRGAALSEERRQERLARADQRTAERAEQRQQDREAVEAVR